MIHSIVAATESLDLSLRPGVIETPLERRPEFDRREIEVLAKLENLQVTGSFKMRGASAKLASLDDSALGNGVFAASTGNHGVAVAAAAAARGATAHIFISDSTAGYKVDRIRDSGGNVTVIPGDPVLAESAARRAAADVGAAYVSPYNDPDVVAGQGTIARELLRQQPDIAGVVVAVGGGGLISGIGANLKSLRPSIRVVAASAANSAAMHHSIRAGRIIEVEHEPTRSDGTAGGIEAGTITFELCRQVVDDWVLVEEDAIAVAMDQYHSNNQDRIEGSAAMALAALQHLSGDGTYVAVMCGGNPGELRSDAPHRM